MQETDQIEEIKEEPRTGAVETMYVISPCGHSNKVAVNNNRHTCSTCGKIWVIKVH